MVLIRLDGHLTEQSLRDELMRAERMLTDAIKPEALLVNCLSMTSYDAAARSYFVAWHGRMRQKIRCSAIVLTEPLWHLVVTAMSLASKTPMKAFGTVESASRWASTT